MNTNSLFIIALGVLAFALAARKAEQGILTAPMTFVLFGLAAGNWGFGLIDLPVRNEFINALAEITLVLALFSDASRIDVRRLNAEHDLPLRLLGIGLPLSIIAGTVLSIWLFPGIALWEAALIGVILAPTDAALGQAVVANERVPNRIRQALNVESGLNDGLAFPVLLIFLSLASISTEGHSGRGWMIFIAAQLLLGPLVGIAIGFIGSYLVEWSERRAWMNNAFLQISVLSLAVLAYTGAELVDGNGFIAAFAAGITVGTRSRHLLRAVEDFGETEGQLLGLLVFLLFGAVMVPIALDAAGWQDFVYAILSLTLVRMAPVALSLIGTKLLPTTVIFLGWFGPRGLASVIYLLLIVEAGDVSAQSDIFATVVLTVFLSVILHGVSAAPAARLYGAHMKKRSEDGIQSEHRPVTAFRIRFPGFQGRKPAP